MARDTLQPPAAETGDACALTVYYDGGCPICSREIAAYQRMDQTGACRWVDITTAGGEQLGIDLSREQAMERFHVRRADGTLVSGARGFIEIWQRIERTRQLGRIAGRGPIPSVLEIGYRGFLQLRRLWR